MAHSLCAVFVGVALCGLFSLEISKFFAIYDLALQQVRDYLTDGQLPSNSTCFLAVSPVCPLHFGAKWHL